MTLLDSLPTSYKHLITTLETRPMKKLTKEFVTARLMHEVTKRNEINYKVMRQPWSQTKPREVAPTQGRSKGCASSVANKATFLEIVGVDVRMLLTMQKWMILHL